MGCLEVKVVFQLTVEDVSRIAEEYGHDVQWVYDRMEKFQKFMDNNIKWVDVVEAAIIAMEG